MKGQYGRIIAVLCVLLCTGAAFGYGKTYANQEWGQLATVAGVMQGMRSGRDDVTAQGGQSDTLPQSSIRRQGVMQGNTGGQDDAQPADNESVFMEKALGQGATLEEAGALWERLLADDIFKDDEMELTGLNIEDMDGNGQTDMLVMVLEREEKAFYGSGALWIYMNEEEPYCFDEEECSYYGWFDSFAEDIDNDGNVEIVFSAQGSGCGAVGDSYKVIFKYKEHKIEQLELPTDFAKDDSDKGIIVSVYQEPEENRYSAYCSYFKEIIYFTAQNSFAPGKEAEALGGNARGFFHLRPVKYKGKNALQASEYLYGEGGVVHNVGIAQFIILWDENGDAYIDTWWIEEDGNQYANGKGSRIAWEDGYCYYASQIDHYYLYRAKDDGSEAVCIAKVHPGAIYADGDVLYFVNLSDNGAIYRMGVDGSALEKLCDATERNAMQVSAEYIYFRAVYDAKADIHGLLTADEIESMNPFRDDFLYRMRKDGSGKELLLSGGFAYEIVAVNGRKLAYEGNIYCDRYEWNEEAGKGETIVTRYDLDGGSEEEVCRFDFNGDILVSGEKVYCFGSYGEDAGRIALYVPWNDETISLPDMQLKDYCIYKGSLYGLAEEAEGENRLTMLYKLGNEGAQWEEIYRASKTCEAFDGYYNNGRLADIYATGNGLFFRQFVSSDEGVQWFFKGEGQAVVKWEKEDGIPMVERASMMEYTGEWNSIKYEFESTDGYEDYLDEELTYEAYYAVEEGEGCNPYTICLPQFNEKIEGYREMNAYFQRAYQEALEDKEVFYAMLDEKKEDGSYTKNLYEGTFYDYVYIGEDYISVAKYESGYWGGRRAWHEEEPVTFERKSGKTVSLEALFGMSTEETVSKVTASIYKYMESVGRGDGLFFLREEDILTKEYDTGQFFLFPEGIGIYYRRYAIDCGAAGDYLFIVPYPEK